MPLERSDDPVHGVGAGARTCRRSSWSIRAGQIDLARGAADTHEALVESCGAGTRYHYVLDGDGPYADPASRSQPDGVHGPSEVVDLAPTTGVTPAYRPRPLWEHVISEVHIGTLHRRGHLRRRHRRDSTHLAEVGVSAIEIMPVAQFPGRRNWGYDGVFPFAVQNSYGGAAGLQRFVDACHQRGLAVILDVVYNHLGPEGNVLDAYAPYFTDRYRTPWGPAVNFDGPASDEVRAYFVQNALPVVHATSTLTASGSMRCTRSSTAPPPRFWPSCPTSGQLGDMRDGRVPHRRERRQRPPAGDARRSSGGLGMDAQWNDDFHHALHAALTGERTGTTSTTARWSEIARAMDEGFVYQGEYSAFRERRHGGPSVASPPERFVVFAQNHDQIGNRPEATGWSPWSLEQAQLAAAAGPAVARRAAALHGGGVRRAGAVPVLHRPRRPRPRRGGARRSGPGVRRRSPGPAGCSTRPPRPPSRGPPRPSLRHQGDHRSSGPCTAPSSRCGGHKPALGARPRAARASCRRPRWSP